MAKTRIDKEWQTMPLTRLIMCIETKTVQRRQVRYRLFRIREDKDIYDNGLRSFIEKQFKPGMSWKNFTYEWDVAPNEPLKVVSPFEWQSCGGRVRSALDPTTGRPVCDPSAFTHQGI